MMGISLPRIILAMLKRKAVESHFETDKNCLRIKAVASSMIPYKAQLKPGT